jgi:hypothetical protein
VISRIGIDLRTIDLTNDDDRLWLNALIWPEHNDRKDLFNRAAERVKENPIKLIDGNGVKLLAGLTEDIPKEYAICVFHTHVANQMSADAKENLLEQVSLIGSGRDIFHIYNNIYDKDLHLDYYLDGKRMRKKLVKLRDMEDGLRGICDESNV